MQVTNIEFRGSGSDYLWIHFGFIYFFTAVVCWRLWAFLLRMVALRTRYLKRLRRQTIEDAAAVVVGDWGARGAAPAAAADAALDAPIRSGWGGGGGSGGATGATGAGGAGSGGTAGGGGGGGADFATFSRSMSTVAIPLQVRFTPPLLS